MKLTDVLKKPIITEKTLLLAGEENTYTFEVDKRANKNQIKQAVKEQFGVKVLAVKTTVLPGKKKRRGVTRLKTVTTPAKKKAFVKLEEKDKIDLFEVGG